MQPHDLPSDKLIIEWRDRIPDKSWKCFYSVIAAYGLRPHESFLMDFDAPYLGSTSCAVKAKPLHHLERLLRSYGR